MLQLYCSIKGILPVDKFKNIDIPCCFQTDIFESSVENLQLLFAEFSLLNKTV